MKLRQVNVIIVTQYFETLNQFPDTVSKIQWFSLRNRVLNVSESTRIHLKLLDRLHLTLIWIQVKDLYAIASKFPYTAYLTKRTGTSFIRDKICSNNII